MKRNSKKYFRVYLEEDRKSAGVYCIVIHCETQEQARRRALFSWEDRIDERPPKYVEVDKGEKYFSGMTEFFIQVM